jgi:hypothetical protein
MPIRSIIATLTCTAAKGLHDSGIYVAITDCFSIYLCWKFASSEMFGLRG